MRYAQIVSVNRGDKNIPQFPVRLGRTDLVTIQEFYQLEGKTDKNKNGPDGQKGWRTEIICPHCGAPNFANDSKAGAGFRVTASETEKPQQSGFTAVSRAITRSRRVKKLPGFSHHSHTAKADCPQSFKDDKRFQGSLRDVEFDWRVRKLNEAALNAEDTQRALGVVRAFLMRRLTGQEVLTDQVRATINPARKKILAARGLHQNKWTEPFMSALMAGAYQRTFGRSDKLHWVIFVADRSSGTQSLPYTYEDGTSGFLSIPRRMVLCFWRKRGLPTPLIDQGTKQPVTFQISRQFAASLVLAERSRHPINDQTVSASGQAVDIQPHLVLTPPSDDTKPLRSRRNPSRSKRKRPRIRLQARLL
jgi:hypothetical protein